MATHFQQLLQAATAQPQPQRLLFVFTEAELPSDATPAQRERFAAGQGGALTPLACVDKGPEELSTFEALVQESRQACPAWQVVFIAALSGQDGRAPSAQRVEAALQSMVDSVRGGRLAPFMALDARGEPLQFS